MPLQLEQDYRLRWLDFDRYGHINPVTVLDICQDLATLHAEQMGIGHQAMLELGTFWVIIRMKFEVINAPKHYQTLHARTWPHSPTNFSFQRDFLLSDEEGNPVVKATSEWVLMSMETRKFAKVKDYYHGPNDFSEERAFPEKPRKITKFGEENRPVYTVAPTFSDIDVNGHVNNARYSHFVMDALNPGEQDGAIRTFQIDFRYEVLPGEPVSIHTSVQDGKVLAQGVNEEGVVAFACAMETEASE